MADHYEVVTNAPGFGSRLMSSIKGIFVGFILIVAAFPLLWWGENRQNLAEFIKKGTLIAADAKPSVPAATLVKTAGRIHSNESVNDDKYLVPGEAKYLKLRREMEMYAWREEKKTEKRGDKDVTTYDYKQEWTSMPQDSGQFYDGAGHQNPKPAEEDASFQVKTAQIGNLEFDAEQADLHGSRDLAVTEAMVKKDLTSERQVNGGKIYIPHGAMPVAAVIRRSAESPAVGDLRLSFSYFPNDVEGSAVGDWDGGRIVPHVYRETHSYLGAYPGSLQQFQATLQAEHSMMSWIIRIASLFMLWAGLNMLLGPVFMLLGSIPILGEVGRFAISLVTGVIAFVLWLLTIVLANFWLVLIVVGVLAVGGAIYFKKARKPVPAPA